MMSGFTLPVTAPLWSSVDQSQCIEVPVTWMLPPCARKLSGILNQVADRCTQIAPLSLVGNEDT